MNSHCFKEILGQSLDSFSVLCQYLKQLKDNFYKAIHEKLRNPNKKSLVKMVFNKSIYPLLKLTIIRYYSHCFQILLLLFHSPRNLFWLFPTSIHVKLKDNYLQMPSQKGQNQKKFVCSKALWTQFSQCFPIKTTYILENLTDSKKVTDCKKVTGFKTSKWKEKKFKPTENRKGIKEKIFNENTRYNGLNTPKYD